MAYYHYPNDEQTTKSEWNIDDAVLKAVYSLKIKFLLCLERWDLEGAYWTIRLIDSEITPALKDSSQEDIEKEIVKLEKKRVENAKSKKDEGRYYQELNRVYKKMNAYMIDEGWYFRKKEMYMGL